MSFPPVERDARVANQIRWLESAGYRVDILSRGPEHPGATGRRLRIAYPPLIVRLAVHALLPPATRFRWLIRRGLPLDELVGARYDVVLVNDHHLLPWVVREAPALAKGPLILDLHEIDPNNGTSIPYRLLISRYIAWLLTFISSPVFTGRLSVAEGIADIYRDTYDLPRPSVIRNVVPFEDLEPSPVDPERIVLVHHGYAVIERGIDLMLDAALEFEPRYSVVLMAIGDRSAIATLRAHPAVAAGRVTFREPVAVADVAKAVNEYDLELVFFPPRSMNNRHALPNKFFEAVQGRLGVVIGESPEMSPLVRQYGLGCVVDGWSASDLARTVNGLTADDIAAMKQATRAAARDLSAQSEGPRFIAAIGDD